MAIGFPNSLFLLAVCIVTGSVPFARALMVVDHPKNASVYYGQSCTFSCKFDQSVKCSWTHKGIATDILFRYNYVINDGSMGINTLDCSIQISNISAMDVGVWQCMNKIDDSTESKHSDFAYLSILSPVRPNRTAILVNGTQVTDIWVPRNGAPNGTLTCVAEYAIPVANLSWSLNEMTIQSGLNTTACADNGYCITTLKWVGDWKPLTNSTTLKCNILQFGLPQMDEYATLKNEAVPKGTTGLQAGAIAGIVIAVILVIAIIIAIVVYCFVIRPRYQTKEARNITMTSNMMKKDFEQGKPSPAVSVKSNSSSAETVRMNDRQPAPQSPVKTALLKTGKGQTEDDDDSSSSEDSSPSKTGSNPQKPDINNRYSTKFSYASPNLIRPAMKS